uniref:WAT1-related protein At3g28050-like isoform X2 n=1 Tax=Erigeron canadensis TaxID=72917 RepID=UPI001CB98F54|nr:WAT1-related protein At3g28050-like isoform X2 [Erigeron canadensis]
MKEYAGMMAAQVAQVLLMIVRKSAIADGMPNYSFIFYSNALASLILLPLSLISHRSSVSLPPLNFRVICGILMLGLLGFMSQIFGYYGTSFTSAALATTLLNLIPGFTLLLAILYGLETVNSGRTTTHAKFIGTGLSIAGALIVTSYKGPLLWVFSSTWVLGGILLAIDSVLCSLYLITQAFVIEKYPAVMIITFAYCFVCTILSALTSLIVGDDLSSFSLQPNIRLYCILYLGIFGSAFQVTMMAWCLQRKGPVFVAMFYPVGIVISTFIGIIFLGDGFYFHR